MPNSLHLSDDAPRWYTPLRACVTSRSVIGIGATIRTRRRLKVAIPTQPLRHCDSLPRGGSHDEHSAVASALSAYSPRIKELTRRNSESGATHPALPAVVLLVAFAVFMAAIAPMNFSSILRKFFPKQPGTVPHQSAAVWVDYNAGVYYCADSIMFGKTKGQYMKQVDALDRGYQPALGTYCTGPAWHLPAVPVRPAKAEAPAPAPQAGAPLGENPFENPRSQFQNQGTAPPPLSITH